jgi:single-stranded DNA-binding protein
MINENTVLIGGRVLGWIGNDGWAELWLRVPYLKDDGGFGSSKIPIDLVDNKGLEFARSLEKGDLVILHGRLTWLEESNEDGNNRRLIRPFWDGETRPTVVKGNGSVPELNEGNAQEGINIVRLAGFGGLTMNDKKNNLEHPKVMQTGDGKPMAFFDIGYLHRKGEKARYFNICVFGGAAEKKVGPYLRDGDVIMVRGQLGMRRTTRDKFKRPNPEHKKNPDAPENKWVEISTPTLWVNNYNGVDFVTPKPIEKSNDNSGGGGGYGGNQNV